MCRLSFVSIRDGEPPPGFTVAEWVAFEMAVLFNCHFRDRGGCEYAEANDQPWCVVHALLHDERAQNAWLFLRRNPPIGDAK